VNDSVYTYLKSTQLKSACIRTHTYIYTHENMSLRILFHVLHQRKRYHKRKQIYIYIYIYTYVYIYKYIYTYTIIHTYYISYIIQHPTWTRTTRAHTTYHNASHVMKAHVYVYKCESLHVLCIERKTGPTHDESACVCIQMWVTTCVVYRKKDRTN